MTTNTDIQNEMFENFSSKSLGYGSRVSSSSKKNLEKIVYESKSTKGYKIIDRLFSDKARTLKATVNALLEEVENRRILNHSLVDVIDKEESEINSELTHLKNLRTHYDFERDKERNKSKSKLEERVHRLEEEKRKEAIDFWRDTMFLKKYLMSALREYWDVAKRKELLERDHDSF